MCYLMRIDGENIPPTPLNLVFVSCVSVLLTNYPNRIILM